MSSLKTFKANVLFFSLLFSGIILSIIIFTTNARALDNQSQLISLTFDDGPDPRFTPVILDVLKKYDVKATFFVTGDNATLYPELIKRIVIEGHSLANHTMTHPHLELLTKEEVYVEITNWDKTIEHVLGYKPENTHYFRPPRGKVSDSIREVTSDLKKEMVFWDVCVENKQTTTPRKVKKRVMNILEEKGGGIVLAHDGILDRSLTSRSLPGIIKNIKKRGYTIVPLDQYLLSK